MIRDPKRKADLFYREGSSDKVYHVTLDRIEGGGGYTVNFAYGRRGSTLTVGTKTATPVPFEKASEIFDKLVQEKMAKGYTSYEGGTPYSASDKAGQVSGILPQLLNPIEEHQVQRFITDPDWCMQEKFDGRRILIRKKGENIDGINRKGLVVALPEPIRKSAEAIPFDFIMDGEAIGDSYHTFDLLEADADLRQRQYEDRYMILTGLCDTLPPFAAIKLVDTAWSKSQKENAYDMLRTKKAEGVVFKLKDVAYACGRPNAGGPALKFKFYATCSAIVDKINDKRSVRLILFESSGEFGGDPCEPNILQVGNVTIPPNHEIPSEETVVEIRYLYAYKGGSLYQPVYIGPRDDIEPAMCTTGQLKYKAEGDEVDA